MVLVIQKCFTAPTALGPVCCLLFGSPRKNPHAPFLHTTQNDLEPTQHCSLLTKLSLICDHSYDRTSCAMMPPEQFCKGWQERLGSQHMAEYLQYSWKQRCTMHTDVQFSFLCPYFWPLHHLCTCEYSSDNQPHRQNVTSQPWKAPTGSIPCKIKHCMMND